MSRSARQLFDRMPIAIARREVHFGEVGWRHAERRASTRLTLSKISAQSSVEMSRMLVITFRTVTLVCRPDSADAPRGRSRRRSCRWRREPLVQPDERRRDPRILIAQALEQLERRTPSAAGRSSSKRGAARFPARSAARPADAEELVGERVGLPGATLARRRCCSAARRRFSTSTMRSVIATAQSSPIVNGCTRWVGAATKRTQHLPIEPAVGVRHERPGESEDPRIALQR